jgi:hypothetical protein
MIEQASPAATMKVKYATLTRLIQSMLGFFQIASRVGSVVGAYCPGSCDLAVQDKKIAGMSQHWFRNRCGSHCVVTAASLNVEEPPDVLADVVNRFHSGAGSPIRCQAAALTNMRQCNGTARLAGRDLMPAVMNQLGSRADMLGGSACQDS